MQNKMIFRVPVLLDYVRKHFPVAPGDLVLTGDQAAVQFIHGNLMTCC